jgi:trehalose 6-phosphate phosphatase
MSKTAIESQDSSWFFKQLSVARNRVLFVDYDGTIAPFAADRQRAFPYPKIPEILRCIMNSCCTRLIMVSGRAATEVPPLLGLHPVPEIWGTHGIERIHTDGRYEEVRVSDEALQVLAQAEARLDREGLTKYIEVKLAAVALHWRGLPPADILNMRTKAFRILEPLAAEPDLMLSEFDEGVEIRLTSANKGWALRNFLCELNGDVPVAYLGDDATDEDAFRVLNGRGLSVLVGSKPRFTAAQLWLKPPEELVHFLSAWIRACGGIQ